jgi:hypothetical protein
MKYNKKLKLGNLIPNNTQFPVKHDSILHIIFIDNQKFHIDLIIYYFLFKMVFLSSLNLYIFIIKFHFII